MNKHPDLKKYIVLTICCVLMIAAASFLTSRNAKIFDSQTARVYATYLVRVDEVLRIQETENPYAGTYSSSITDVEFRGTVLYGEHKGETVTATQSFDAMVSHKNTAVEPGNWIYVSDVGSGYCIAGNYFRIKGVAVLFVLLLVFLILFAGIKGVSTTLALGFTIASVFLVFVPAILSGYNIYLWAILVCLFSIVITPLYVGGFNIKSVAAAIGSAGGVLLAAVLTVVMTRTLKITGFASDEAMYVITLLKEPIDMRAIVFAATLIGALGSTLDVSMSIAASVWEMHETNRDLSFREILRSGFNIGRDILGTQISTLILAYIGSSLSTVLLLVAYQSSVLDLLNLEVVILQLLDMLIGASTILLTIPFTAAVSAVLFTGHKANPKIAGKRIGRASDNGEERVIFKAN